MKPNVLYVEDDVANQDVMRIIAHDVMGIDNFVVFENSENFMSRVAAIEFDLDVILLDIHVPPIDGFEMLRLLRQDARFASLPIAAITASVMNEEVQTLKDAGFDGVIAKPVDMDQFPRLLQKLLDGHPIWTIVE